VKIFPLQPTV